MSCVHQGKFLCHSTYSWIFNNQLQISYQMFHWNYWGNISEGAPQNQLKEQPRNLHNIEVLGPYHIPQNF